jgi:hypothetical protein
VTQPEDRQRVDAVVRTLATAGRSLRLYPPSSPIPQQNVEAAQAAFAEFMQANPMPLILTVQRDGLAFDGELVASTASGPGGFVDELRDHGVAAIEFDPACTAADIMSCLTAIAQLPAELADRGGVETVVNSATAGRIRIAVLQLTRLEAPLIAGEELDDFLRSVAADPAKFAAWFAAAAAGDPETFEEGLVEIMRAVGEDGLQGLLESLSLAFLQQEPDGRDSLLGLAMDPGVIRQLTGGMFGLLAAGDIAGSILGGNYGRNMLSLSRAITALPLEQVTAEVRAEIQAMLPTSGHTPKEATFLDHMIDVRERQEPEPSLVDTDATYRAAAKAATLPEDVIERGRDAVAHSRTTVTAASLRTMLAMLDQQTDRALFDDSLHSIGRVVGGLIEHGDLSLAATAVRELSIRQGARYSVWPDLAEKVADAIATAVTAGATALLQNAMLGGEALDQARDIVGRAGDSAVPTLATRAAAQGAAGVAVAEELLGRRVLESYANLVGSLPPGQAGHVAARLLAEGDSRSMAAVDAVVHRGDPAVRRDIAMAIAQSPAPAAGPTLAALLADASGEVAAAAARSLAHSNLPGSARILADRLGQLDIDNADFELASEIIGALARVPDPAADEALRKLAGRRALIKRGHFAEIQTLANQALRVRTQRGGEAR